MFLKLVTLLIYFWLPTSFASYVFLDAASEICDFSCFFLSCRSGIFLCLMFPLPCIFLVHIASHPPVHAWLVYLCIVSTLLSHVYHRNIVIVCRYTTPLFSRLQYMDLPLSGSSRPKSRPSEVRGYLALLIDNGNVKVEVGVNVHTHQTLYQRVGIENNN